MTPFRLLRTICLLLSLGTCPFNYCPQSAHAAEPAITSPLKGPAARRVALWQKAAPVSRARYTLTRHTSLLWDPLVVHGTLTLTAPNLLELRDDERTGATTRISSEGCEISANDTTLPPGPAVQISPAVTWLHDHLVALLTRDPDAIIKDARISVPRGSPAQFDLNPTRSHPARATIDHLRVRLDPDTGGILELELVLTAGDRVVLTLGEPRSPV